ncbi:SCO5918 family protein [Streptomyces marianii]|uniref:Uncharacterized protein n=1 Tax=Streptomyces marianii TaxID=1817406 RepID=A0A5R9EFM2_9ACTN|nr:SCO5918 family protein [Streptomyces marianii]TLQ47589.1 hypothetical protein FEF34_35755 [Streptomyces marianii]
MRCVIARFPFELTKDVVLERMKGVRPEPVTGMSVTIGRRQYPVMQAGAAITRQDRRDFSAGEVVRALTQLGFVCRPSRPAASDKAVSPFQQASDLLGGPAA